MCMCIGGRFMRVSVHALPEWDSYHDKLIDCAYRLPKGLGKDPELRPLRDALQALIPCDLPLQKDACIIVEPGESVDVHQHSRTYAATYYVQPGDPPVALLVDGERIIPERGMVIVIPPMVPHGIERNTGDLDRVSFAILVGDDPKRLNIERGQREASENVGESASRSSVDGARSARDCCLARDGMGDRDRGQRQVEPGADRNTDRASEGQR